MLSVPNLHRDMSQLLPKLFRFLATLVAMSSTLPMELWPRFRPEAKSARLTRRPCRLRDPVFGMSQDLRLREEDASLLELVDTKGVLQWSHAAGRAY